MTRGNFNVEKLSVLPSYTQAGIKKSKERMIRYGGHLSLILSLSTVSTELSGHFSCSVSDFYWDSTWIMLSSDLQQCHQQECSISNI